MVPASENGFRDEAPAEIDKKRGGFAARLPWRCFEVKRCLLSA